MTGEPWWTTLGVPAFASQQVIDAAFVREVLRLDANDTERLQELANALREARKARA
jgi:hypothetical protein